MARVFWLSDCEWARIEPHLPRGRRGARRVDDRRVISGIVHMLRSGARWRDCPGEYGPYTTVYNRFNRWSRQGVWHAIFEALTGETGIFSSAAIDSTHGRLKDWRRIATRYDKLGRNFLSAALIAAIIIYWLN